jgi:hypothetical protein
LTRSLVFNNVSGMTNNTAAPAPTNNMEVIMPVHPNTAAILAAREQGPDRQYVLIERAAEADAKLLELFAEMYG